MPTGSLASNSAPTTQSPSAFLYESYGITEAVIATVVHTVSPGPTILGAGLSTQSGFWGVLDTALTESADCIAQAGLTPGFYDVTIPRSYHMAGIPQYPAWMDRDLKPGLLYMVFSDAKGDIRKAIEDPMSVELLTDKVDTVGDVELILGASSLPAAVALSGPAWRRRI